MGARSQEGNWQEKDRKRIREKKKKEGKNPTRKVRKTIIIMGKSILH